MRFVRALQVAACFISMDAARADETRASKLVAAALSLQDPRVEYVGGYPCAASGGTRGGRAGRLERCDERRGQNGSYRTYSRKHRT